MAKIEQSQRPGHGPDAQKIPAAKRKLTGLARMFRYRLVIPIARGRHNGVPTARGTAIGLFFGLTPTVGVQMPMILVFWAILKALKSNWNFNLIVALAWTWPTNLLTAPFYYYLCLMTGRLMMGDGLELGFEEFRAQVDSVLAQDASFIESLWIYTVEIFSNWGVPLFLGCIPWTLLGTWGGYHLTLKFIAKLRAQQRRQMLKRHARLAKIHAAQKKAREEKAK